MVCPGDEGWLSPSFAGCDGSYGYSGYEGVDYVNNLAVPTFRLWHLSPVPRLLRLYLHGGPQSSHRRWQSRRKACCIGRVCGTDGGAKGAIYAAVVADGAKPDEYCKRLLLAICDDICL